MNPKLHIAETGSKWDRVSLMEPAVSGYIHIAAEVDRRPPFLPASRAKKDLLEDCKSLCRALEESNDVKSATVFRSVLMPPGRGAYLKRRPDVHIARFDVAILIETESVADAERLRTETAFTELEQRVRKTADYVHVISANNARRIDAVDHTRDGVFLFNYFFADDIEQNLAVWEYTAGWFVQETGLDNSTLLMPLNASESEYTVINHCRWDRLRDILPSLIFKRSFPAYVLKNFEANNTAAMPVLYRLA